MNTSIRTRSIVIAGLVAGAIAPVASAAAAPVAADSYAPASVSQTAQNHESSSYSPAFVIPQTAQKQDSSALVLRRDGSKAEPFVADVGPQTTASSDGFDWGDAALGAGAGLAGALLVGIGASSMRGRRGQPAGATSIASTGV